MSNRLSLRVAVASSPLCLALLAAPAAAEPGFLGLDRQDGQSRVGGDVSYIALEDGLDGTALRFDLHGQYVLPSGVGFYGAFPITYISGDDDSATGIADLEVGAIYIPRLDNPQFSIPLHVGVTLPTASDELEDFVANVVGASARITDLVQIVPEGFSLRVGASPTFRSGQFFGKADVGLDVNLSAAGDDTLDPLIRVNAGAGVDLGNVAFAGELLNTISTDGDAEDQVVTEIGVSVRAVAGNLRPYGGLLIPIDDGDTPADFVVTAGLEGVIR
jgi:hypothetical protein